MKKSQIISLSLTALACATPAAWSAQPTTNPQFLRALAADSPTDDALSSTVLDAILGDDILRYDAGNVQVSTRNGIVTLSGTVHRQTIRQRMELVAHSVRGVARVVNLLSIAAN